ncbi:hypothetical protein BCY86_02845 [Pajaroellobacter abortibovis]|uniref:Uncharacterized protein n=1 Tax=Pajaroellobacter abortibovis TaxID=1882918 RepID=A0A1L6MWB4_9BACT|nr:hypothetical protein BCY86_02845 [Pajaroellobacter abortibovis]
MILAALFDLGFPLDSIQAAVSSLQLEEVKLHVGEPFQNCVRAANFQVTVHSHQSERPYRDIDTLLKQAPFDRKV